MSQSLREFGAESYFAKRIEEETTLQVFAGTTDPHVRRERIRSAIIECGLAETTFGKRQDGSRETFRQAYERYYAMPLQPSEGSR